MTTRRIAVVRQQALEFLGADPAHFDIIFTQNTTAAIKIVTFAFQDAAHANNNKSFWYGFHKDCHTSLVGVREFATSSRCFTSDHEVEEWISQESVSTRENTYGLFAYPGQSNMTGRRLPQAWYNLAIAN